MKIIHCADIHIGSSLESLPADKAKIRRRELLDTFNRMLDFAKENDVRAVIIAGDFFDGRKVSRSVKKEIIDKINSLPGIDFLYLAGNHDADTELADEGLDLPENLKRFDTEDNWRYFDYGNVCIAGIETAKHTGGSFCQKLKFHEDKFNIAVLHGEPGAIQFDRLRGKRVDYLALGDRHVPDVKTRRLDQRGEYAYSGCLEGRGFDEPGERGFFLLCVENGKLKSRTFCPISKRKHQICVVDITSCDSHSSIEAALKTATGTIDRNDLIRVVLKGKYKAGTRKELDSLEVKLNEEFFYAQIKDESKLDEKSVDYQNEKISLRREFVELVMKSGLEQEEKDRIIDCGIKALSGEEIDL